MRITIILILLVCGITAQSSHAQKPFDRSAFYSAMAEKNLDNVNAQIQLLNKASFSEKDAFTGALLMKKAGLVSGPGKKLKLFKEGHKKLEPAISKDSSNAELRFLRLMIQENAPGILNYNNELNSDSEYITKHFAKLPAVVQKAITDYSKQSKTLKAALL